ncbi:MAG: hypothetical protein JXQ73_16265 [Phycisphaerae bacterium]|nr:hypothetical protein [Phycisphaerae bacterium]
MGKRASRWPIWKIVVVLVVLIVAAIGLFVASAYLGGPGPAQDNAPADSHAAAQEGMSNLLTLLGAISSGAAVLCVGWLVVRYYQSIPAWKKRAKLPAHRRK